MTPNNLAALYLVKSAGRKGLTNHGNAVVSFAVPSLLRLGLIEHDSSKWVGYKLTSAGLRAIA